MRSIDLSITHTLGTDLESDFDISKAGYPAPDDRVSRWPVTSPIQIAPETGMCQAR